MLLSHGLTDVGRQRALNEDTIHAQDGLFLVCDGMGGHKAGEVASLIAAETIAGFVRRSHEDPEMTWPYGYDPRLSYDANRLSTAMKLANRIIFRKAASTDDYTGMGTTVSAVLVAPRGPQMTYAHVGDSRVYLIRRGTILPLTRDDSLTSLAAEGAQLPPPMKNILTKAIGAREEIDFEVPDRPLLVDDVVLLCSDGLTNMLSDERILAIVEGRWRDVEAACHELVEEANAAGGRDNVSVVLLHYTG